MRELRNERVSAKFRAAHVYAVEFFKLEVKSFRGDFKCTIFKDRPVCTNGAFFCDYKKQR